MNPTEVKIVLVSTNPTKSLPDDFQGSLNSNNLVDGGVVILAILAMTYFSKTLIKSIADLLKVSNQKKR
ncbi:MAG: hypothetical protein F6K36_15000 [Symploca sp. SIO3C6]|uniref:Uncharacterized protein n=1 Tax=Symploca sp. SIO1C4 TaxID=2607765 RepID=A0A6B3NMZ3_9CYAN|nr:hypothetical protein [Symploca sp. SIO3C6]NER32295.1 hypothetical protein [Symploca sp. SIO1C4]NET07692.1 hypothetical protein [Symploca sp. SIO2B6]